MMMRFIALILLLAVQSLRAQNAAAPAAPATPAQQLVQDPVAVQLKGFALMGVFVVGMWFLLIAPQRKKAKELEATLKGLKTGDKIVTSSGILGVVLNIKDNRLSIR